MSVHFSSKKMDWATPDSLYNRLHELYSFDLDAAASAENARCLRYYDERTDGLTQSWEGARVWCNPPYGRHVVEWVNKAIAERKRARLIVMLVPARTDTRWFHLAVETARVEFLKGRLKFKGAVSSAPFPSALLIWGL